MNLAKARNCSGLGVVVYVCNIRLASTYKKIKNLLQITLKNTDVENFFFWKLFGSKLHSFHAELAKFLYHLQRGGRHSGTFQKLAVDSMWGLLILLCFFSVSFLLLNNQKVLAKELICAAVFSFICFIRCHTDVLVLQNWTMTS